MHLNHLVTPPRQAGVTVVCTPVAIAAAQSIIALGARCQMRRVILRVVRVKAALPRAS